MRKLKTTLHIARLNCFTPLLPVCLAFFMAISAHSALAQSRKCPDPEKQLSQLLVRNWTAEEGLPSNNLISIVQSSEGYLWMGSYEGLVQFDGASFRNYHSKNLEQMRRDEVLSIAKPSDGGLWIGTQGEGLLHYRKGQFQRYESELFMNSLYINEDQVWIGTQGKGVHLFNPDSKQFSALPHPSLAGVSINDIAQDQAGNYWFATEGNGIVCKKGDEYLAYSSSASGVSIKNSYAVKADASGMVWAGTTSGLFYLDQGEFRSVDRLDGYIIYSILFDPSGSMWVATSAGLFRRTANWGFEMLLIDGQNAHLNVRGLELDQEGNIWFTTYRSGLFRIRDGKFTNYTYRDGLSSKAIGSLALLNNGDILVGSVNGSIDQISGNKVKPFPLSSELPKDRIYHLLQDREGNVWISTYQGLFVKLPDGTERHYTKRNGLHSNQIRHVFQDSKGQIWVGSRSEGVALFDLASGKVTQHISKADGLGSNFILSISEDQKGNILVGTVNGGLNILIQGRVVKTLTDNNGIAGSLVFDVYEDEAGVLWICTNSGLTRKEGNSITNFTTEERLPDDAIFNFLEDQEGQIWMPTNSGIISIPKDSLNAFAQDSSIVLPWELFDKGDGMRSDQCSGATHSVVDREGKLWIPTFDGVVKITPDQVYRNTYAPPVHVNAMKVDGEAINLFDQPIGLEPGAHRLVFEFSGLSMIAPEKVRFRYKVEGYDQDWIEDTHERRAIYTNLPPGEYTFNVIATNNDGVWNTEGASVRFRIPPFFTQTWWFYGVVLLLAIGLTALFIQIRTQRAYRRNLELQKEVDKRTRELSSRNKEITEKTAQLSSTLNKMTDSVRYALRIQQAILRNPESITRQFKEGFIFLQPRDIVSGDFYWYGTKFGKKILIASDCTGHGVPGAFMTVMGNDMLNEIVSHNGITEPASILRELDRMIYETFQSSRVLRKEQQAQLEKHGILPQGEEQGQPAKTIKDGMDMAVLAINEEDQEFEFAGAKNPLYIIREGKLMQLKGSKFPIGGHQQREDKTFEQQKYALRRGDTFYLFSDGYQDQFGGPDDRKFMKKRFREMLASIGHLSMAEQKAFLQDTFYKWKGEQKQTDDILVVGVRV